MPLKVVLFVIISITIFKYINCGEYYREDGRNYYVSYPESRNWYQALRYCAYSGMYLVDIHTSAEHYRIRSVINRTMVKNKIASLNYWMAGTDLGSEGNFYWATTGHQFMYLDWAAQQPDNSATIENCVHSFAGQDGKWNDFSCNEPMYFICRDTFETPSYKQKGCSINTNEF